MAAVPDDPTIPCQGDWRAWVVSGMLAGAAAGLSTALGPPLLLVSARQLLDGNPPDLLVIGITAGFVGGFGGLLSGILTSLADDRCSVRVSRLFLATVLGSVIWTCLFALVAQPLLGFIFGTVCGFSSGIWVTKPELRILDRALPLRGRWLWRAVTGLLILVVPGLYVAWLVSSR